MSANDNPQTGQGRFLPKKEADLFKSVVKFYEGKQYKKGLKASDGILKKFPNHGETLCMKGLIFNCTDKKEEAHALVKKGLMFDMRSHVCWHVYGLLYRSDRDYNEAIKAYKQALRIDPENLQILRDLSMLQIQMRDLDGFAVTRHTILTLKPNNKMNWLAFSLGKHLCGDLTGAISVVDSYLGTMSEGSPELRRGFESSELAMYRNTVMAEIPDNYEAALKHLDDCKDVIVDVSGWLRARGLYQLKLGSYDDAKDTYMATFKRGETEDYRVHSGYMCALLKLDAETCEQARKLRGTNTVATMIPLTSDQKAVLLEAYVGGLESEMPRSPTRRRIIITLLEGDKQKEAVDEYCRRNLTKGVPSLGPDLSALFLIEKEGKYVKAEDPVDVKMHPVYRMIEELVNGYITSLTTTSSFPGAEEEESPSTILWTWYLRALLHERCGEYPDAIAVADKCLEHTPTAVDVYELKARVLKAAGGIDAAAECIDTGRDLDKQDRYINNQTTKYMLQANREDVALERISLFTRHEGNPEQNLFDMQCTWYELELADCMARKGNWGKSLKKYMAVEKHFDDFHEDQFDFHSYCIRKVTLRAYVDILRYEDNLWGEEFYGRAAEGIIRCYLHLYDNPDILKEEEEPDYASMTAAQRKKAKAIVRKKKKALEKKNAAEEEKNEAKDANGEEGDTKKGNNATPVVVDEDPNGDALLKFNPLDQCKKYVMMLVKNAPRRLSTWLLQFDVAIRRGKALMALQALYKAKSIDADNSEIFTRTVAFMEKLVKMEKHGNVHVSEVISSESANLLGGKNLSEFISSEAAKAKADPLTALSMKIAIANAMVSSKTGSVADAASLIVDCGLDGRGVTAEICQAALKSLDTFGKEAVSAKETWAKNAEVRFPLINK